MKIVYPAMNSMNPAMNRVNPTMDWMDLAMDRVNPMMEWVDLVTDRMDPALDWDGSYIELGGYCKEWRILPWIGWIRQWSYAMDWTGILDPVMDKMDPALNWVDTAMESENFAAYRVDGAV
ncbi:hypothetical protein CEXT_356271 [Caerostris extrusa]|uniref:Uncharacterized protein n=1 Tax=Caerostris extrusa TaxID=172846 RepID=A0AAV4SDM6_CAEEX|nr:hypothetical protein CEXT_356271 [Caerostris extrusa]